MNPVTYTKIGLFGQDEESENDSVSLKQIEKFRNKMAAKIWHKANSYTQVANTKDIDEIKDIISKKMDKK